MVIRLLAYSCSVSLLYSFLSVALSDKLSFILARYLQLQNFADGTLFSSELIQTSLFNSHGHHQLKWLSNLRLLFSTFIDVIQIVCCLLPSSLLLFYESNLSLHFLFALYLYHTFPDQNSLLFALLSITFSSCDFSSSS